MKYLQKYNLFEGKAEAKAEKRIRKFFNVDYVIRKTIELSPKLSVWIINGYKDFIEEMMASPDLKWLPENNLTPDEVRSYMKTGKTDNEKAKMYVQGYWADFSAKIQYVLDWVNSFDYKALPPEERDITKLTYKQAYEKSDEWHNSLVAGGVIENEHGKVIMKFPDGFYWIDLETTYDRDEADAMGHCGNTDKGNTLYSLRDRKKSPHVTASVDEENGIVYQMKGRNNKKPIDKYHMYIVGLLGNDDLEYPLKGFGAEYDKANDFEPDDLDADLLAELKEKRPDIDAPVHTPEDISEMFGDMMDSYYMQEDEYAFRLVEWCYDVAGFESVLNSMDNTRNEVLFDILCKEFPEKIDSSRFGSKDEEEKIGKLMLDIASRYINADDIANKYNITLSNPKESSANKWDEIYGYIGNEGLENELKDQGVWDKYEHELDEKIPENSEFKEQFVTYPYYWDKKLPKFDIEELLKHFFGDDEKEIMKGLAELFDGSDNWLKKEEGKEDNYWEDVTEVFDLWELVGEMRNKMTTKEMEEELENNEWYAYMGDNY